MYLKKVEYLKSLWPPENCISAITTVETTNRASVGTPCIASIKPFAADKINAPIRGFPSPNRSEIRGEIRVRAEDQAQPAGDGYNRGYSRDNYKKRSLSPPPGMSSKGSKKKATCAKDLYKMDISKANDLIRNCVSKTNVLFAFSTHNDYIDYYTTSIYGHQIYFNGVKPIILDDGKRFELSRISDVHNKTDLNNFAEMTYNSLQDNRYINYTFTDVMESNKRYMMEDVNLIFGSLKEAYPHNISCFRTLSDGLRGLIDVVSISFYRLPDVVAVFDFNNMVGVGVEVLMTNSLYDAKAVSKGEQSVTHRFLFSSTRENLFTIDGESVARRSDSLTDKALGSVHKIIGEEVPYDKALKGKKSKTKRVGG